MGELCKDLPLGHKVWMLSGAAWRSEARPSFLLSLVQVTQPNSRNILNVHLLCVGYQLCL